VLDYVDFGFRIDDCELNMNAEQLKERTKKMSIDVYRLVSAIPHSREADVIVKQIVRSSSSVAANYRAACKARSKADFISKVGIVEEEADETSFWVEYLVDLGFLDSKRAEPLQKEIKELVAIFTASGRTAKQNRIK
jgi:four helix bundle protein